MSRSITALLRVTQRLFSREKTLRELMAEQGRNEFGRAAAVSVAQAAVVTRETVPVTLHGIGRQKVRFVSEFSYDKPGTIRAAVLTLNNREFQGVVEGEDQVSTWSWGKVRGLMKVVDTGEMLSPYEVYDLYH
ncbi:hypothetical protein KRX52_04280 [Pseudomonas sp. MAP12]|uniref:Uncharacterized protein n=1 Tax=Geopseudomonas aromaticivorans TaxID=2849492 RepID=A0ABS6MTZ7_9GAMM|nr:hypothetical protein [Pseudomonas aromaticivorans]MBV2132015.1 hypothetical protein [Pseudomonas aromaticivorans]